MRSKSEFIVFCYLTAAFVSSCTNNDVNKKIDCTTSDLAVALVSKTDVVGCKAITGSITVNATGGKAPYDYSLNGGVYTTKNEFLNLGAGSYNVKAKDANNCDRSIQIEITASGSTLSANAQVVQNNKCNQPNGSATITASGGKPPYLYLVGTGGFSSTNAFTNLKEGIYNAIVKDAEDCQKSISITIPRGLTGVGYSNEIQPLLSTTCNFASCHGAGTGSRDWTTFANVKASASNIKSRTGNGSMPIGSGPKLTQQQINLIACWVDDGAPNN
jgi:hypothetical protein